ncbi:MAG: Citrinin biosynthesis cluster MFS transporter mrr1 [Cirrosporium novae-zelandiae]|nr:MAG: Citrinin biosynthesis cluster MFS transporter mrr1 [Cirrosporium novae-zelandiae]
MSTKEPNTTSPRSSYFDSAAPTPGRVSFNPPDDNSTDTLSSDAQRRDEYLRRKAAGLPQNEDQDPYFADEGDQDRDIEKEGADEPQHPPAEDKDPNLVVWDGPHDKENPMNFTMTKKWVITLTLGFMTFVITFASSVFSTATVVTAEQFHVSTEVMVLGTSLIVAGFAVGPLMWGPLSEVYGRKIPLFAGFFIFMIFQIPVGVAINIETIMLCRFFQGVFGSAPLGIVGGALADFWDPVNRGIAIAVFAAATFLGPVFGPILGGFIVPSHLGWHWTAWITMIMAALFWLIGLFLVPETFAPLILTRRAARLRYTTKNYAYHSVAEESPLNLKNLVEKYLKRPFKMLFLEPILVLITMYMSLIYGILYLFFEAYPISFQESRGWSPGVGALPFLAITIGVLIGASIITYVTKTRFASKMKKHGHIIPEERLPPMILGGVLLPIGLFWFAWTSNPHISWVPQVISGIFIGCGIYMIFLQALNYIVDVYLMHANSAIAANTLFRSLVGAGFPMFASAMYHNLGIAWATSLLAFLCTAMAPVPVLFYFYGKKIRAMSRYSPTA